MHNDRQNFIQDLKNRSGIFIKIESAIYPSERGLFKSLILKIRNKEDINSLNSVIFSILFSKDYPFLSGNL